MWISVGWFCCVLLDKRAPVRYDFVIPLKEAGCMEHIIAGKTAAQWQAEYPIVG